MIHSGCKESIINIKIRLHLNVLPKVTIKTQHPKVYNPYSLV